MHACLRSLWIVTALLHLIGCDKPDPLADGSPLPVNRTSETENQLVEARDALQRQALEIETKTALMDKQLAEMEQSLKDRENDELRGSLEALKQQNQTLRAQADTVRRQSDAITRRIATTAPPVGVTPSALTPRDHSVFYEKLAPHGRWMEVSGYGYCWRPRVTTPGWRPYVDGCWVWSSMGWTWQSNEPFGWATYHYGRWMNLSRHGWVWVPGNEWAPAWVSWRQSRDHVGWAPLPPDRGSSRAVYRDCDTRYNLGPSSYTFINTTHFVRPSYTTVFAPVTQNITIFQSSVNVTQIVRCDDRPHCDLFKHHGGPSLEQMERVCERPVPHIQVQSVSASQIRPTPDGYRPGESLANPVLVELPVARTGVPVRLPPLAERIEEPRLLDAFEGVPQREAVEIREMISAEGQTAAVQRPVAVIGPQAPTFTAPTAEPPAPLVNAPAVESVATETVRPIVANEDQPRIHPATTVAATDITTAVPTVQPAVSAPAMPPLVVAIGPEEATRPTPVTMPAEPTIPVPTAAAESAPPVVAPFSGEISAPQPPAQQALPTTPAMAESLVPQQEEQPAHQRAAEERMALEQAAAAEQRAMSEKAEADRAMAAAEAERAQLQANAEAIQQRQQEELAAQQRAMAEERAAAEAERAREDAEAVAMQRRQEDALRQQQEMAQREAEEQAHRAAEEQMRQQQEMAQREAEEQARRAAEEQMRQQQEMAQRQAEEQARRAAEEQMRQQQEMAQRQAEEQARRAAEEQMRQQQEMAQRQAEEQARRAAEEQMRQQQEMAQRQAEEQSRRAAEEQMRRAQEEAQRAAAEEAARRQP
jgi:DNA segregation ATPase FtsK/SpoIIIE-like protein